MGKFFVWKIKSGASLHRRKFVKSESFFFGWNFLDLCGSLNFSYPKHCESVCPGWSFFLLQVVWIFFFTKIFPNLNVRISLFGAGSFFSRVARIFFCQNIHKLEYDESVCSLGPFLSQIVRIFFLQTRIWESVCSMGP